MQSLVTTTKVRLIEKTRDKLKSMLMQGNPWERNTCPRQDCHSCKTEDKLRSDCTRPNITYVSECTLCKDQNNKVQYLGESSRSLYERTKEYISDAHKQKPDSQIFTHGRNDHPEIPIDKVISRRRKEKSPTKQKIKLTKIIKIKI